jgi:hypothetical protein
MIAASKSAKTPAPKSSQKGGKGTKPVWSFPKNTLEDAIRVPKAIEEQNAGNPLAANVLVKAVGFKSTSDWRFLDLLRSANLYGLIEGSGKTAIRGNNNRPGRPPMHMIGIEICPITGHRKCRRSSRARGWSSWPNPIRQEDTSLARARRCLGLREWTPMSPRSGSRGATGTHRYMRWFIIRSTLDGIRMLSAD